MIMWQEIRLEALNLISKIKIQPQLADIDQYILGTGYQWAPHPHESTIDLLTVYAANLRNTSGGGPLPGVDETGFYCSGKCNVRDWSPAVLLHIIP
jgi:hypothetical protein